jgi:transcriptional regulator of acetoin/glycerol metabolism
VFRQQQYGHKRNSRIESTHVAAGEVKNNYDRGRSTMTQEDTQASLHAAWSRFIEIPQTAEHQHIKEVVLQAWQRCRDLGIDPQKLTFAFLSDEELEQRQRDNADLITAAEPYMEYLSLSLSGTPHVVALADQDGWIISLRGTPQAFGGKAAGMALGSSWAETQIGNNGIGTALSSDQPVLIYGIEHYAQVYHPATCLGVPIRVDGVVRGALDVSVLNDDADPARLTLTQACVASIETALFSQMRSDDESASGRNVAAAQRLVATTVHDLKQPLTSMRAISQLGSTKAPDDQARHYFEMIQKQVDRVLEMVDGMLQQNGRSKVIANPVLVIDEVLKDVSAICAEKRIDVRFVPENTLPAKLDLSFFRRAMQNIVMNAIEVMNDGGILTVRVSANDDTICVAVSDTGPGIPREIQDHIFEPFVGGRAEGTGLGLSTAHHAITEVHDGKLWFCTEEGTGTTFFMKIPAVRD